MPNLVEISDFVGTYQIASGYYSADKLEPIRDEHQFDFIYKVLGAELGALFIADLNVSGVPVTQIYVDLYNAFQDDEGCDGLVKSEGIKKMIVALIFFYWCAENKGVVDISSNTKKSAENSTTSYSNQFIIAAYNKAVESAKAIQWYIGQNSAAYPTYMGKKIDYMMLF